MRNATAIWIGTLAAIACAGTVRAHHSGSMYVTTATWIKGTVVRFDNVNPHSITTLEQRGADGEVRRWAVEGPPARGLARAGSGARLPKASDVVEFCAFGYKPAEELSRMFPGTDFSVRRGPAGTDASAAGHVMVLPDGEMRFFEPHGVLSECIRSSDRPRQSWLDFLSSNDSARQAWCEQRRYAAVQSNAALQELVAQIEASLGTLCD